MNTETADDELNKLERGLIPMACVLIVGLIVCAVQAAYIVHLMLNR